MFYKIKMAFTAATVVAALLCSQQAMAHAHLASAVPADMSSVAQSPDKLSLTFTEDLEVGFSGVKITDASGATVKEGKAELAPADKKNLIIPITTPLKAGDYQIEWHALSVDGHKTQGKYMFTVK